MRRVLAAALLGVLVSVGVSCGARSSLDRGGGVADGSGGSGGEAPATTTSSTSAASTTTASHAASSSSGIPDPELCTSLVWSGEPLFIEPTFDGHIAYVISRPAIIPTAEGTAAVAFSTDNHIASVTFDAWGTWPPALPALVEHVEFDTPTTRTELCAAAPGSFLFARSTGITRETYLLGRAAFGVPGAEIDELSLNLGTSFMLGRGPDDSYLLGLAADTRTFGHRVVPGVPLDVDETLLTPLGCTARDPRAAGTRVEGGYIVVAGLDDPADDCLVAPPFDLDAPDPAFLRVTRYDDAGNVLATDDLDTGGGVWDAAVVPTSPPRVAWYDGAVYSAEIFEGGFGPVTLLPDVIEISTAAAWRDGFVALSQNYVDDTVLAMVAYDASGAAVASTATLDATRLVADFSSQLAPILVSPDGRMFLWGGNISVDDGSPRFALFRAECR